MTTTRMSLSFLHLGTSLSIIRSTEAYKTGIVSSEEDVAVMNNGKAVATRLSTGLAPLCCGAIGIPELVD